MMNHHLGRNYGLLLLLQRRCSLVAEQRFEYTALEAALVQQQPAIDALMQEECSSRTFPDQPSGVIPKMVLPRGVQHPSMPPAPQGT